MLTQCYNLNHGREIRDDRRFTTISNTCRHGLHVQENEFQTVSTQPTIVNIVTGGQLENRKKIVRTVQKLQVVIAESFRTEIPNEYETREFKNKTRQAVKEKIQIELTKNASRKAIR